jgi:hypothetical protein
MATPRHLVEAPAVLPYRYGLFSVAQPRPTELTQAGVDPHWRNGITWVSQACGVAKITQEPCVADFNPELDPDDLCSVSQFDPFTVYAFNNDSVPGFSLAEHEANAVARLLNGEQLAQRTCCGVCSRLRNLPARITPRFPRSSVWARSSRLSQKPTDHKVCCT